MFVPAVLALDRDKHGGTPRLQRARILDLPRTVLSAGTCRVEIAPKRFLRDVGGLAIPPAKVEDGSVLLERDGAHRRGVGHDHGRVRVVPVECDAESSVQILACDGTHGGLLDSGNGRGGRGRR